MGAFTQYPSIPFVCNLLSDDMYHSARAQFLDLPFVLRKSCGCAGPYNLTYKHLTQVGSPKLLGVTATVA